MNANISAAGTAAMTGGVRFRSRGFTLVETALAVVIVAIVLLAAIGLMVPAQRAIDDVLTADEVARLRMEIERELSLVRPGEPYADSFDKAFQKVVSPSEHLVAFFYRAQRPAAGGGGSVGTDGRLRPFTGALNNTRPGEDYLIQAAVMPIEDFQDEFATALEGRLFVVRLRPLEGLLPADSEALLTPGGSSSEFPEAVVPAVAEFFVVLDLDRVQATVQRMENDEIRPLLSLNMGFNR